MSEQTRSLLLIVLVALLSVLTVGDVAAESLRQSISGDLDVRAYYNDVEGNKSNSFLTEGPGVLSDVYFYYDNTSADTSQIQWDGLLYLQGTDDPRFEIRNDKVRIRNAYLTAKLQNHWKATGGYFSENFTSFTFNSSLLGLNTSYHLTDSLQWKLFGGRANRARPGNQFRRFAEGTRLEWTPVVDNTLSLNYVRTHDDEGSLKGDEISGVDSDTETNVVRSVDYDGEVLEDLQLSAEFALSDFDSQPATGSSSIEDQDASRASLRWRPVRTTEFQGYYEKVDPDFQTLSGFARANRELSRLNWNQKILSSLSVLTEYEVWEDGLESSRTNNVTNWSVKTNYTPHSAAGDWWRRRLTIVYESQENQGETEGITYDGTDSNDKDQYTWGVDFSNQFGATELNINYGLEEFGTDSETIKTWDVTLERRFELAIPVTYSINGFYKEQVNDQGTDLDANVDRSVRFENDLILAEGRAQELHLYHWYTNEHADASSELVDHTVGADYRHVLNRKLDSRLSLSLEFYDHQDKGDPTQDYQEETIQLRYQTPF